MRKLSVLFCLLIVVYSCSTTKNTSTTIEKSLLWKVTGKNLKQDAYLFGTIHMICEDKFILKPKVENALNQCSTLVLEADTENIDQMGILQKMTYNEGDLTDYIPSEIEEDFLVKLKEISPIPFEQGKQFKPFFFNTLMLANLSNDLCDTGIKSYEQELNKIAGDIKHDYFETIDQQLNIFEIIPDDVEIEMLYESIKDMENTNAEFIRLMDAYANEDLSALLDISKQMNDYPQFEKELLENRNTRWVQQILQFNPDEKYFIAVGAMHLPGKNGLIELLKKEGYTVEPVF